MVFLNLPYCNECEKYIDFVDGVCSNQRSHRLLVTCNYCQNDFKTFNDRKLRCSVCCRSNERKLKTFTFEKLKKLANVYNIKRRKQEFIIDDLVKKLKIILHNKEAYNQIHHQVGVFLIRLNWLRIPYFC